MTEPTLRTKLAALLSTTVLETRSERVEGGCINDCFRYATAKGSVFVKVAEASRLEMFEAEAEGLRELSAAQAVRVPIVLGVGSVSGQALLALEWLDLRPTARRSDAKFGAQLAQLHRVKKPLYGWKRNNFIGSTPQANLWSRDWVHFWRTHRFDVQLDIAVARGADARLVERAALLSALMDGFFTSYIPEASLLHGDLWSGNYAADERSNPVIFDPAAYFGDRECDLAMTRLFGGFSADFYAAYRHEWPLDEGWPARVDLYNLYHVLNHYNLFGGGYLSQAAAMIDKLLAELGH